MTKDRFDDLRPYYDEEINAAMCRIADNPLFPKVAEFLYPDKNLEDVKNMIRGIKDTDGFQIYVMYHTMSEIIKKTIDNFTFGGLDNLDRNKAYIFVSNHRDILLDSALLQVILFDNKFRTSEITFGSNLMTSEFIVDIGKSNKMFKVIRGGNPRDFYKNSLRLSQYIRYVISERKESVWIAQRNGRTKDGNDQTDQGLVKMFAMSSKNKIPENLAELNIVPVSVSYQWETCDLAKVKEIYIARREKYVKEPSEDLHSIINGITQYKGNVHIEISKPLSIKELNQCNDCKKNELFSWATELIDKRINKHFKLWDNNFIAYDIENGTKAYMDKKYSKESYEYFIQNMKQKLSKLEGDAKELEQIYLGLYSNPLKNMLR